MVGTALLILLLVLVGMIKTLLVKPPSSAMAANPGSALAVTERDLEELLVPQALPITELAVPASPPATAANR